MSLPQVDTPWMTAEECAAYMKFSSLKRFYGWLETHPDFPRSRRGERTLLIDRRNVDAYLRGDLRLRAAKSAAVLVHRSIPTGDCEASRRPGSFNAASVKESSRGA